MKKIYLSLLQENMTDKDFDFLKNLKVHAEFSFSSNDVDQLKNDELNRIAEAINKIQASSTIHAPFFDLNIASVDKMIRNISYKRLVWALNTAQKLGSTIVVIHPAYGNLDSMNRFDKWFELAAPSLEKLVKKAQELQIKIAFENIYDSCPDYLAKLCQQFDTDTVGICFDVGHYNIFSETSIYKWLETIGNKIIEVHLHDNDGTYDQHLAIGDGNLNYQPLVEWLNSLPEASFPALTLEVKQHTHAIKSVNYLKNWLNI